MTDLAVWEGGLGTLQQTRRVGMISLFTCEETEGQSCSVTCPKSRSQEGVEQGLESKSA